MRRLAGLVGLLTAEAISLFGSRMTAVALPWLVLVTTGSATKTGLVALTEMLPYVIASAAGGPLIDRLGARRISVVVDVLSAALVAAVPLLHHLGRLDFGLLLGLVGVIGLVRGFGDSAKRVLLPAAIAESGVEMTRAVSLYDGIARAATLVGAPLAGVLAATFGAVDVLLIDAASFAVAAFIIGGLVRNRPTDEPSGSAEPAEPYFTALRTGLGFVRREPLTLGIVLMLFATNLFDQAYTTVFVPVWSRDVFGSPAGIGLLAGVFALGAVAGNAAYTLVAPRWPRLGPFAVGFLIGGAPRFLVMALDSPVWTVVAMAATAGVAISVVNPILSAVSYEVIPERLQARVFGLVTAAAWAGIPAGSLLGGLLVDLVSLRAGLLITGLIYLAVTLVPFFGKRWRRMDAGRGSPGAAEPAVEREVVAV
ncbi:MFS family permease [Allocatelliglobosispora scoriae]|uniref:MFS family permease n=1 Tax=Allocatelliglobosispora scoriae TaxID=643052 RepID=A0A841BRF7_9ACTN|nr:MFS transporter [Allocatelliglobosispora scoriae]MBB5870285.1 MFS family permease [Allocatelliglobosispora scoriae]